MNQESIPVFSSSGKAWGQSIPGIAVSILWRPAGHGDRLSIAAIKYNRIVVRVVGVAPLPCWLCTHSLCCDRSKVCTHVCAFDEGLFWGLVG